MAHGGSRAVPDRPAKSPSGRYILRLARSEEQAHGRIWGYLRFQVLDRSGQVVFDPPHRFATWFPLTFAWDTRDRVWVLSGDEGVRVWACESGVWTPYVWQADGPETPDSARKIWDAEEGREVPIIGGEPPVPLGGW